jgi:ubiquitin-protein ligase
VALLENPNAEDALEAEIGAQMTADMSAFEAEAKSQTAKYAM